MEKPGSYLTRSEYLLFQDLIGSASGLHIQERDWTPLRAALCERASAVQSSSFGEYYELLRASDGTEELSRLIELLTVHETAFFRNQSHFDLLVRRIIPELVSKNGDTRRIKIWSAGCSTGQEAYSIAISLLEALPEISEWQVEVVATDISHRALDQARVGIYPSRSLRNVDPTFLDRYFEPADGGYQVSERVRKPVRFEYLNLVKEPFPLAALSPMDVVFCENVTIYFKLESTRRVIRNFYDVLSTGGYLFLGYSETLWQISEDFSLREMDGTFVYQRPSNPSGMAAERSVAARATPVAAPLRRRVISAVDRGRGVGRRLPARRVPTLEEATAFYESRRFEEALLAVEGILAADPGDAKAQLLAAKLRADREEVGPAIRHCRRVLEIDPLSEEGYYLMGILLMRAPDGGDAGEYLARVIYLNPAGRRSALAHFHLAGLHADVGEPAAAVREYRSALRLLERFAKDDLVEEFSADFLARVCRRRLEELGGV